MWLHVDAYECIRMHTNAYDAYGCVHMHADMMGHVLLDFHYFLESQRDLKGSGLEGLGSIRGPLAVFVAGGSTR